jgi:hypothetical protein
MITEDGWIGYSGQGDNSHLTDAQRRFSEQRMSERRGQRGQLLAVVQVHIYEHSANASVTFPREATLGPDSDSSIIADVVTRARQELLGWR